MFYFLYALFPLASPRAGNAASPETSPAVSGYAYISDDTTFFYTAKDESVGLFLLPKTYYVKILEASPDFCKVEYMYDNEHARKLVGYAKTSRLTFVDYTPKTPYPYAVFDVHYRLEEESKDDSFLNQITASCAYYGDYKIGSKTYCYVLRGDAFGYIPKPADLTIEENLEYAERQTQTPPPEQESPKEETSSTSPAQVAVLIAVCLLVPVLAALVLKPSRRPRIDPDD